MTQPRYPLSVPSPIYAPSGRFAFVASHVLGIEGGHVNNPADRGGETKYGISLRFLVAEGRIDLDGDGRADFDLDRDGDIDGADIRLLSPQQALNLYYHCFWERLDLGSLPRPLDGAVFDQAVNGGGVSAGKILQRALNRMSTLPGLRVDGDLGPATRKAVSRVLAVNRIPDLILKYRQEAELRYQDIVRRDPSQVVFLKGWAARARRLGDV
jgi:lysozyme family protein